MIYTKLSLAEIRTATLDVARDAETTFGSLSAAQLNWRASGEQWSVGQCFRHSLTGNDLLLAAARLALANPPHSVWQRVPLLPRFFGRALIRSQSPQGRRKYTAPATTRPTASKVPADIIQSFATQHRQLAEWIRTVDESDAARRIMVSPFVRFITYSVLDGLRLLVAHDHRHFEQARRVTQNAGFPAAN